MNIKLAAQSLYLLSINPNSNAKERLIYALTNDNEINAKNSTVDLLKLSANECSIEAFNTPIITPLNDNTKSTFIELLSLAKDSFDDFNDPIWSKIAQETINALSSNSIEELMEHVSNLDDLYNG